MRKILVVMLVVAMLLGLGVVSASSESIRAAFITQAFSNPSQAFSKAQFEANMEEFGFEVTSFEGENDVQKEAAAVRQCIVDEYPVIFINPSDILAIVPSLMEAKEAGIIIGMFSSEPPHDAEWFDFFVGCDDFLAGERAATAFLAAFPDGANIVEVGGQAGHDAAYKRREGFLKGIEGSGIVILDSQNPSGWNTNEAMAIAEDFIVKYGDQIEGVFCHWDNGATGVLEAFVAAGRTDVFIVGVDGNSAGYQQVKDGKQAVTIGQSFTQMARKSMEFATAMLNGEEVDRINHIPHDVVTLENIETFPWPEW